MSTTLSSLMSSEISVPPHGYQATAPTVTRAHTNACLIARIGWCHRQAVHAITAAEAEQWWAEEQGLVDALLHRNTNYEFQGRAALHYRYVMGLEDGAVLLRMARVRPSCHHRYDVVSE